MSIFYCCYCFIVITIKTASSLFHSIVIFCSDRCFSVIFFSTPLSLFCLLPAAPCSANSFFCHSNMCINNSLVCNGVQNCVYPWDENHCKGDPLLSVMLFPVEVIMVNWDLSFHISHYFFLEKKKFYVICFVTVSYSFHSSSRAFPLQRSDRMAFFIRSLRPMALSLVSHLA